MASLPVREDASAFPLSITLHQPITGDPYTYLASAPNAALAVAAAFESVDEQTLTDVIADLTVSPMLLAAKACYRADLRSLEKEQPVDAADRENFALMLLLSRVYLGGVMQGRLPKGVRNA